nr:uncharacterized protein LOC110552429 [Meriones unguiculatus]
MSRCHTGAGRAGQGGAGEARGRGRGGRRGEWLRPRPPPVLSPGPPRRPRASLGGAGGGGGGGSREASGRRCFRPARAPRLRPRSLENAGPAPRPASQSGAPRGVSGRGGEPLALPWSRLGAAAPSHILRVGGERAGAAGLLRLDSFRCWSEPSEYPADGLTPPER